jgi:hypothetical protein
MVGSFFKYKNYISIVNLFYSINIVLIKKLKFDTYKLLFLIKN